MAYRFCFGVHVYEFAPASEIIVQESADFRAFIALDACENVYGLGQFSVSEGWRILSRIDQRVPCAADKIRRDSFSVYGLSQRPLCRSDNTALLPIYTRFIRLAANPAPKPLSILTTVTPAAQEFSMPKSAAMPWKLAP